MWVDCASPNSHVTANKNAVSPLELLIGRVQDKLKIV